MNIDINDHNNNNNNSNMESYERGARPCSPWPAGAFCASRPRTCRCWEVPHLVIITIMITVLVSGKGKGGPSKGGFLNNILCS